MRRTMCHMADLHIELPDDLYARLQANADRNSRSVAAQIVFLIEAWLKEERRSLESLIGAISLGHPTDMDNDSINADLARAYAGDAG